MHVCHVWERFWPLDIGGLERYIIGLSRFLAKNQKIDFSLITGRTKFLLITKNIKKVEDAGFIKVYRLGPTPIDLVNGAFIYAFHTQPEFIKTAKLASLCREAAKWETAKTADVFHIHGIWGDLEYIKLGVYLSQHFKKPLVVTLHGGFIGDPLIGGMPLKNPEVKNILINNANAITTYSKEVLDALEQMGLGSKTRFLTNFVNTTHFTNHNNFNNSTPSEDTVIFVSRLEPVQNPEIIIKAFKLVNKECPNAKLNVVGYGTLFEALKRLIADLNLQDNVFLMGKQTDVRKFLWNSDIFVATNFGYIASLEAWSAGLAVIAPKFGILRELISHGDNGLLVTPNDAEQLALAIISLLKNRDYRATLAFKGAQTAKSYDISSVAPKMAEVYQYAIEN